MGAGTLVGKSSFKVFVRKVLSLALHGAQDITGAQSEPLLELVLVLGGERQVDESITCLSNDLIM